MRGRYGGRRERNEYCSVPLRVLFRELLALLRPDIVPVLRNTAHRDTSREEDGL